MKTVYDFAVKDRKGKRMVCRGDMLPSADGIQDTYQVHRGYDPFPAELFDPAAICFLVEEESCRVKLSRSTF